MRGSVERSAVNTFAITANESLGARQHFLRRTSRERQQQYSLRGDTTLDQMRDAVDECAGLSGSRSGYDEQWSIAMCRSRCLLWIQLSGKVAWRSRSRRIGDRTGRINLERVHQATVSKRAEREVTTAVRSKASANFAVTRSRTS